MSVVVVQVGQCGNQLGEVFFRELDAATKAHSPAADCDITGPFFTLFEKKARCVLVDSEPKVIGGILQRNRSLFRAENAICGSSGCANNWSSGYNHALRRSALRSSRSYGARTLLSQSRPVFRVEGKDQSKSDDSLLARALRAIHTETHRVEDGAAEAIVVFHSLAGGTGSGMGCRIVEKLREHYTFGGTTENEKDRLSLGRDGLDGIYGDRARALFIISVCVLPMVSGETAIQSINTTLALDSLSRHADAVLLLRNDDVTTASSFDELNRFFVSLMLPVFHYGVSYGCIGELVANCAPDPRRNLLTLLSQGGTTKRLSYNTLHRFTGSSYYVRAYGIAAASLSQYAGLLRNRRRSAPALFLTAGESVQMRSATAEKISQGGSTLVLNQAAEFVASLMDSLLRDCAAKLDARAYVHRFEENGVTLEQMENALRRVGSLLLDY